jgi:hypothetical protein
MSDEILSTSVIDIAKWNQAGWRGVLYVADLSYRKFPVMGLIFRDKLAALDIFAGWRNRFGQEDEFEQLRIAVIEGDIGGQHSGYTVHITSDVEGMLRKCREQNVDFDPKTFIGISRIYRMNPSPRSKNVANFKEAYARLGTYLLIPVTMMGATITTDTIKPHFDLKIVKRRIYLRDVKDIGKNDIDSVALVN